MNIVLISGNAVADPTIGHTGNGKTWLNVTVATTKQIGQERKTTYHKLVAWERVAQRLQGVKKGQHLFAKGELQTRTWDKDGTKQYITEVVVNECFITQPEPEKTAEEELFGEPSGAF